MIRVLTWIGSAAAIGAIVLFYAAGEDSGAMIALFLVSAAIAISLGLRKAFHTARTLLASRQGR